MVDQSLPTPDSPNIVPSGAYPNPEPKLTRIPDSGHTPLAGQVSMPQGSQEPIEIPNAPGLLQRGASRFGDIAKNVLAAINGPQTRPQVDEAGKMTEVPVPQDRPGQIFRHILAGAILGGAAAQEEHNKNPYMGFSGGVVAGGKAVIQDADQKKVQQKKQASDDWERDQEAQKNAASIALQNIQQHHFLTLTAGLSLEQHDKLMEGDQVLIDALAKAHVAPDAQIPVMTESQAKEYFAKPENIDKFHTHRGLIVGRTPIRDAQGNLDYEFKLAFYDKNADITVDQGMRAYFKSHGVLVDKNSEKVLQVGKKLKPEEAAVLFKQARDWDIQNMQDPKSQAEIAAKQAETAFYKVKADAERQDILSKRQDMQLKGEARAKAMEGSDARKALDVAYSALQKAHPEATIGDALTKLKPSQQIALLPSIQEDIAANKAVLAGLPRDQTMWSPEEHAAADQAIKQLQNAEVFSNITHRSIAASQSAAATSKVSADRINKVALEHDAEFGQSEHEGMVLMFDPTPGLPKAKSTMWVTPEQASTMLANGDGVQIKRATEEMTPTLGQSIRAVPEAIKFGAQQMLEAPGKAWKAAAAGRVPTAQPTQ